MFYLFLYLDLYVLEDEILMLGIFNANQSSIFLDSHQNKGEVGTVKHV